jgi:hypothetical protein
MNLTKADTLVERGASALESWARDLAVDGGFRRQVAEELLHDAAFLRKLKPSLIASRARGESATVEPPVRAVAEPAPTPEPPPTPRPRAPKRARGGLNPFAVAGAAFVAGVVLAKVIDWRGHAHPKR